MNILLINPPIREEAPPSCFPLGLAYIGAVLLREGHNVQVLDINANRYKFDEIKSKLKEYNFDCIGITGLITQYNYIKKLTFLIKREYPDKNIIVGGSIGSTIPKLLLDKTSTDVVIIGEGENTIAELFMSDNIHLVDGIAYRYENQIIFTNPREHIQDIDTIPFPAWDLFPMETYINSVVSGYEKKRNMAILTSRGCPFSCLHGDTLINTVEGNIPIKDLVGREKIGVYTYNPRTKKVFITDAFNIQKTGINKELVRVTFDDGTFIDCTPDHKFLTFKNGNQFGDTKETIKKAKDLEYKESVRAIKFRLNMGYCEVEWGRRNRQRRNRMVMEYILGRKLKRNEWVHHKDKKRDNDIPSNLQLCSPKEHLIEHPEVSERMLNNNPAKYLPHSHFVNLGKSQKGKKRSIKSKIKYRKSKLGNKNPLYRKDINHQLVLKLYSKGLSYRKIADRLNIDYKLVWSIIHKKSRIKQINHKVISVFPIGKSDVYCMEVPSTQWFFANNVLVHNCTFCFDTYGKKTRFRSAENVIEELKILKEKYNIDSISTYDETFTLKKDRTLKICKLLKENNLVFKWDFCGRVNCIDEELLRELKSIGATHILYGIESGSQKILDEMKKGVTIEQASKALKLTKKVGLEAITPLMIGFPSESKETIDESVKFFIKNNIYAGEAFFPTPHLGAPLYEYCKEKGLIKDEEAYIESLGEFSNLHINLTNMSDEELKLLKKKAERKMFISYIIKNIHKMPMKLLRQMKSLGLKRFTKLMLNYVGVIKK